MGQRGNDPETDRVASSPGFAQAGLKLGDGASSLVLFALMVMTCVDVVGRYRSNASGTDCAPRFGVRISFHAVCTTGSDGG